MKKDRIKSALQKIKNNSPGDNNNNFFNYFSLHETVDLNQVNETREIPEFCRALPGTQKKPACSICQQSFSLSMESLLHPVYSIGQNDILDELEIHNHPRSRIITDQNGNKHQSITIEAARELENHYVYFHNKEWPKFL